MTQISPIGSACELSGGRLFLTITILSCTMTASFAQDIQSTDNATPETAPGTSQLAKVPPSYAHELRCRQDRSGCQSSREEQG